MRVLVIEDDEGVVGFLKQGLREASYAVDLADNGVDGAHLACTESYDCVVLDLMLPGKDGFTILREMRGKGIRTPVICLTARDGVDDRIRGLDLGADDYLSKPFSFSELLARIRALLRRGQIAQASYTLDQVNASLSMIRAVCGVALLAAVVLSLLGGRILARRSLDPLQVMIRTARQISAHRITERLPRSYNGDELDRLAETLNGLLTRIDQYVRRMQQFTADASHELRTPLAALQGNAEVALGRDRSVEELRHVIESSIDHYQRLRKVSDDLLLLARIDSGEEILERNAVKLDQLIDNVVDLFAPAAAEKGLALTFDRREPAEVVADGGRLRQVIANLLDNAIKYSSLSGQVTVSLARNRDRAVIEIGDTGPGINPEDLPHVFERFYRADKSRSKSRDGGTGLGLAICRSIVAAHGGSITLSSRPQGGVLARVELPAEATSVLTETEKGLEPLS